MTTSPTFLDLLKQRVMVYDGAMGTSIQNYALTVEGDFEGKENCGEILVVTRPDVIREIHASYLEAGADVIETDSFGGSSLVLAEFGIAHRARELNMAAARLAKDVAREYSTADKPRFVAGSMGPTTKLPSLGHIGYDAMLASYVEQAEALIEGGVDVLLIETCQDLLQLKIALAACSDAMKKTGVTLPVQAQITMEATGTMLLGSEIGAALAVLECFRPDVVGLNCATGPAEMNDAVRFLCQNATMAVSVLPNAGLPQNVGGRAVYKLTPAEFAEHHRRFVSEYGVNVVGGCCGTTPAHIKAAAEAVAGLTPLARANRPQSVAASAFSVVPLEVDGQPAIIAEEMNATTRVTHFKDMVRKGDYDGIFTLAKRLVSEGSQLLDICCAVVGEDEVAYMNGVMEKIATRVPAPILIDSTEANVIEEALKRIPGKPIINSINLEDGEKRTSQVLPMARRYGAAVIALTIDEDGMALTAEKKLAVAHRIHKLATEKYGLRSQDLIFDALTLPITTGQEDYRTAGMETLEAVRRIKLELPECRTTLGVSNISFGLNAYARRVLNSVFLKEAVDRGLDSAIVNYSKIYPLYKIPEAEVELARNLIFRNGKTEQDPLQVYMQYFAGLGKEAGAEEETAASTDEHDGRGEAEAPDHQRRARAGAGREEAVAGGDSGIRAGALHAARPDQHRAAGRDEDGGRAVWRAQDAVAFGAGFGGDDEGRGGVSGAEDGEGRGQPAGDDRAGDGEGRRARHRQEPGGYYFVQQRLQGGEPGDQAACGDDHRGGEGAQRGRDWAVGAAGEIDAGDEVCDPGPATDSVADSGDLRRRGADPQVCGGRSAQGVQLGGLLRGGRVCRAACDERPDGRGRERAREAAERRGHAARVQPARRGGAVGRAGAGDDRALEAS